LGRLRRLLFVCARNRLRSPTAEAIFASLEGIEVSSAGTAPDAECPVSADLIEWADEIYVMERQQSKLLQQRFAEVLVGRRIACLDVPDRYTYMQPELIELLRSRMSEYLEVVS